MAADLSAENAERQNTAADAVATHYALQYSKYNIPFSFKLDLPTILPIPKIDLCLTLSNFLENALEASLKTDSAKRHILVQAYLHSDRMILLTVENIFDGNITAKNGEYQSSKRSGCGIGLQSVRHIAEKSGGYSRFLYENGTFCATSYCGQRNNLLIPPISVIIPSRYPVMAIRALGVPRRHNA